ncbi:hypothetical protein K4F52_000575 [Lecanicillium sp. MT-2017a]|nr:hypothetical protein K4F52_000575 [Lecanicillium sp. MT-2017a]
MFKRSWLSLFVLTNVLSFAVGHPTHPLLGEPEHLEARAKPLLPSEDPWYQAPENLSAYAPGDVIRSRKPPHVLAVYNAPIRLAASYQLLYRTNDAFDNPIATATTVMIPHGADFSKFLSYQVEIDAVYDGCFPSYTYQQGAQNVKDISSRYSQIFFLSILEKGWPVVVPDFEGPDGAWVVGKIEGQGVLDGLRAARRSTGVTGIESDAVPFVWGYSGGAHAAIWALELQPTYAPELDIGAAAMGGLAINIRNVIDKTTSQVAAGVAVTGILGVAQGYPEVQKLVDDQLIESKRDEFLKAKSACIVPNAVSFAYKDIYGYFKDGKEIFEGENVSKILDSLNAGTGSIYKGPTYIYHSVNDEVVPVQDVDKVYDRYCAAGANVEYVRDTVGEHITVAVTGGPGALQFMTDRMSGRSFRPGCTKETAALSLLNPKNWPSLIMYPLTLIKAILGGSIGIESWVKNGGAP